MPFRTIAAGIMLAATLAGCGSAQAYSPKPLPPCPTEDSTGCHWDAQRQGNGLGQSFDAPYCMFDAETPDHQTVAGPAGGRITVNGAPFGTLVLVTADDYGDEVRPDAEPFDGIRYNLPAGFVAVDGIGCVTT